MQHIHDVPWRVSVGVLVQGLCFHIRGAESSDGVENKCLLTLHSKAGPAAATTAEPPAASSAADAKKAMMDMLGSDGASDHCNVPSGQ